MNKRFGIAVLVVLSAVLPAHAVTVTLGSAAADCGVPFTLPVSIVGQSGALRTLTMRFAFDPTRARFHEFLIDPNGALPSYRATAQMPVPGSVTIEILTSGVTSSENGAIGTISFSLVDTSSGSVLIDVLDVVSLTTGQQSPQPGTGKPGLLTASCQDDERGRPEVYRYALMAGSAGGGGFADGKGSGARFLAPAGIAVVGDVTFVSDSGAHTIRRISKDGDVTTWAGVPGVRGRSDGPRNAALFDTPDGLVALTDGSLLVADRGNSVIRRISPDGIVSTWAGSGARGIRDGTRLTSQFNSPSALALEPTGSVLVTDVDACTVRRIDEERVRTIAGVANTCAFMNGDLRVATFEGLGGVAFHPTLGVLVTDTVNHIVRRIIEGSSAHTLTGKPGEAGSTNGLIAQATFNRPGALAVLPDNSILVGTLNGIRRIIGTSVETVAGGPSPGSRDGAGTDARMNGVVAMWVDGSNVIRVSESGNTSVRVVSKTFDVQTLAGQPNLKGYRDDAGPAARFNQPWQITVDAQGNLYAADRANKCIRRISPDGNVVIWAGTPGVSGTRDGPRIEATFQDPAGCAIDSDGNLWISEPSAHVIRVVRPNGVVETAAGQRGVPGLINGSLRPRLNVPMQIAVDNRRNIYIADMGNNVVRRLSAGGTMSTLAGAIDGSAGNEDGGLNDARFNAPTGVAVSPSGSVIVADRGNNRIREISGGQVLTLSSGSGGLPDGTRAGGRILEPEGVAVLPDESILFTESSGRIRLLRNKAVSTLAGRYEVRGNQGGLGADALFSSPVSIVPIGDRTFVVSDSANGALVRATLCADDSLCLGDTRFALSLQASDPRTGNKAEGYPLLENDLFGFFSLPGLTGNAANPEVFVKVLDGTAINGRYWVFYGGLTDLGFDLEVRDRVSGETKIYDKPGLEFCGGADTQAFEKAPVTMSLQDVSAWSVSSTEVGEGCDASSLCLGGGRFRVELSARDPRTDGIASGVPIPRTGDFGYFSLPGLTGNASNPEVFVKVLDGRAINGKFWVFYGGLTDFEFTLDVTDGESGITRTWVKPGLEFCGGADTEAF